MAKNLMIQNLESGKMSLGCLTFSNDPNWVEVMALAGLNHVTLDMMLTPMDWDNVRHLSNAARAAGIATMVRLESNPWDGGNATVAQQTLRALALGVDGVRVSLDSVDEIKQLIETGKDWHRKIHLMPFDQSTYKEYKADVERNTLIEPILESSGALEHIDEIVKIPDLRIISIGVSDAARCMGYPFDYENPEVWKFLDHAVKAAHDNGLWIQGNIGYGFRTLEDIAERVKRLYEHGFDAITLQGGEFILQVAIQELLAKVKTKIPPEKI